MGQLTLPAAGTVYIDANIPISAEILEKAAFIRAVTGLKAADAIHAATAAASPCDLFLTNDPHFKRVATLPVVVLSELL